MKKTSGLLVKMQPRELSPLWLLVLTVASVSVGGFPTKLRRTSVRDRNTSAALGEVNRPAVPLAAQTKRQVTCCEDV